MNRTVLETASVGGSGPKEDVWSWQVVGGDGHNLSMNSLAASSLYQTKKKFVPFILYRFTYH